MSSGKAKYNTKGKQQKAHEKKAINDIKYFVDIYKTTFVYAICYEFQRVKDLQVRLDNVDECQARYLQGIINGDYTLEDIAEKIESEWGVKYKGINSGKGNN